MDSLFWTAKDKKEIAGLIDEITEYIDKTVHPAVSPDNWYVYSEIHDLVEQFRIVLKQKGIID